MRRPPRRKVAPVAGLGEFVVADDVGGDVPDSPLGTQRLGVPLGRGQLAEQCQQVSSLFLSERHEIGLTHQAGSSRLRALYLLR